MTGPEMRKTLLTMVGLSAFFPLTAVIVAASLCAQLAIRIVGAKEQLTKSDKRKTVLVSGGKMTKALQLARSFHKAGHRVVLLESESYHFTAHRFSRSVESFHVVPAPEDPAYLDALIAIAKLEKADFFVPVSSPIGSHFDALAAERMVGICETIHARPAVIEQLDNKHEFANAAARLGLAAPRSILVTSAEDVLDYDFSQEKRAFILKSIQYDPIRRLDLTKIPCATLEATEAFVRSLPISGENPWVMQEFIRGTEYCTHGTFRDGCLQVHCCCRSSAFQVNYAHIDKPEIEAWVRQFGAGMNITGQASFDFIEAEDDGQIYAIECNPRTHSAITMFYNHPRLASAYLEDGIDAAPLRPHPGSKPTYWLFHEIWRIIAALHRPSLALQHLLIVAKGKDAVFDWRDPLPFMMLHHWHIPILLLRALREGRGWHRIDFNIGKLVQQGGD